LYPTTQIKTKFFVLKMDLVHFNRDTVMYVYFEYTVPLKVSSEVLII
jgi:hypothetical protein